MKQILVLNGSNRRAGRTQELVDAFIQGATRQGHSVKEIFTEDLQAHFKGKLWSDDQGIGGNPYQLQEVLDQEGLVGDYYRALLEADQIVFATPIYWWGMSGSMKLAVDYMQPLLQAIGFQNFVKESVLLAVAGGSNFSQLESWYNNLEIFLGWRDLGRVLGEGKIADAYQLGIRS